MHKFIPGPFTFLPLLEKAGPGHEAIVELIQTGLQCDLKDLNLRWSASSREFPLLSRPGEKKILWLL